MEWVVRTKAVRGVDEPAPFLLFDRPTPQKPIFTDSLPLTYCESFNLFLESPFSFLI